jgi:hypothetical protein
MAGYSGTPLPKKLGIGAGSRVALVDSPAGFAEHLSPLPADVLFLKRFVAPVDVILLFVDRRADLAKKLGSLAAKLAANGGLWVAWPKKASGVETDLSESIVRELGLAHKLVDNKVCAVDDVWSGLRFVVPLSLRKDWPGPIRR